MYSFLSGLYQKGRVSSLSKENGKWMSGAKAGTLQRRLYDQRYLFLMLLPTIIMVILFVYKPVAYWVIAFTDYRVGQGSFEGAWNHFESFKEFFIDSAEAGRVFQNTLVINLSSLFINMISAMIFAILLNEIRFRFAKSLVQTFSLLPFFVSWVITYSFFQTFFSTNTGLVNVLFMRIGLISEGGNLLGDSKNSYLLMIIANLWKSLGYNSVIFLATIAGIDQDQYEAAEIDGASRLGKIWYITVPGLANTLAVLIVLNSGWILSTNFDQFYQFTNPTNITTMEVFDMYVYRFGMKLGRYSYATAVGVCKTVIGLIMLWIANKAYKKMIGTSIF